MENSINVDCSSVDANFCSLTMQNTSGDKIKHSTDSSAENVQHEDAHVESSNSTNELQSATSSDAANLNDAPQNSSLSAEDSTTEISELKIAAEECTPLTSEELNQLETVAEELCQSKKYGEAAEVYSQLLQIKTAQNKQEDEMAALSIELAPLYFKYGKCLFLLSQAELFSQAAAKVQTDVAQSIETSLISAAGPSSSKSNSDASAEKKVIAIEDSVELPSDEEELAEEEPASNAESSDDLKIAWEALDTARVIYQREFHDGKVDKYRSNLADVYDLLGDISVESEAFLQAIEDYKECIRVLQTDLINNRARHIAEAYYKMAVAYEYSNDCNSAKEYVEKAFELLKGYYNILPIESQEEQKELLQLFPDLEAKIEDLNLGISLNAQSVSNLAGVGSSKDTNSNSTSLPVNDISSMVRKKTPSSSSPAGESKRSLEEPSTVVEAPTENSDFGSVAETAAKKLAVDSCEN